MTKNIEVYKLRSNFSTGDHCFGIGNIIVIIDDDVWIRDATVKKEQFIKSECPIKFIRLNTSIFEQIA